MSARVLLQVTGALAEVTLSNAAKFNAMSRAMWRDLRAVFTQIQQNPQLRCVVVRGAPGRDGGAGHFCAGGDISEYAAFRFDEASLRAFHEADVWEGLQAMLDCDLPIIAQIEGNCMGAGVEVASCCDLRFASDAARFGAPIARLGFPMAPREAALVARCVGALTAREMLLTAAVLDAPELKQRGFLNQVLPTAELAAHVQALAERTLHLAPQAARLNKQALRILEASTPTPALTDLLAHCYQYAASDEHREGVMAFVEKRPARFAV